MRPNTNDQHSNNQTLLKVDNLKVQFSTDAGILNAVDGITFQVDSKEIVGIVGESGCGKSVTSLALMGLIQNPGKISEGKISFLGEDIMAKSGDRLREMRGKDIAMVFQEPMTALNPVFTIGHQIDEMIQTHFPKLSHEEVKTKSLQMLVKVGIPAPDKRYSDYPHQLSGGMRQRVMIAMAMSCNPKLLIADEPTTALDVTIQAQILDLMRNLQRETGTGLILITHDLGVVAELCDRVIIMYAGKIVEEGTTDEIFYCPAHPYTKGLLNSIPNMAKDASGEKQKLSTIPGMVPSPMNLPQGCRFQDRCPRAQDICRKKEPTLESTSSQSLGGHKAACYFPHQEVRNV